MQGTNWIVVTCSLEDDDFGAPQTKWHSLAKEAKNYNSIYGGHSILKKLCQTSSDITDIILQCRQSLDTSVAIVVAEPSCSFSQENKENEADGQFVSASHWQKLREFSLRNSLDQSKKENEQKEESVSLAERIHYICDSLPNYGCMLDVIITLSTECLQSLGSDSQLALYGVLKRLQTWHNGQITFLAEDQMNDNNLMSTWKLFLHADVLPCIDHLTLKENLLWRGQAVILDTMRNTSVCLPGMSLVYQTIENKTGQDENIEADMETDEEVFVKVTSNGTKTMLDYIKSRNLTGLSLSNTMEILEEVDIVTLPSFLFSPCQLHILACEKFSQSGQFIQHVQDNTEIGYISRIPYRLKSSRKLCMEGVLSTASWKETIATNTSDIHAVEENFSDFCDHVHFLLTSNKSDACDTTSSSTVAPSTCCTAYMLRSPQEINGGMMSMLHKHWLLPASADEECDMAGVVRDLPQCKLAILEKIGDIVIEEQRKALQEWIDYSRRVNLPQRMSERELLRLLEKVQDQTLEEAFTQCPAYDTGSKYILRPSTERKGTSDDWPEKQALKLQECCSRKLTRFTSSDSFQQSSPIQAPEGEKTVDVSDFLKLFKADGSSAGADLQLLQLKFAKHLPRRSPVDITCLSFSYNRDRKSERLELQYSKMKDRYVLSETKATVSSSSSGVLDQTLTTVKPRVAKKATVSPVRRSPRKRARPRDQLFQTQTRKLSTVTKTEQTQRNDENPMKEKTARRSKSPAKLPEKVPEQKLIRSQSLVTSSQTAAPGNDGVSTVAPSRRVSEARQTAKTTGSRSDRHKRRLEQVVHDVLKSHGIRSDSDLYQPCSTRLYRVTKLYAMDLPSSRNLMADMIKIAEGQVQQVIDLEMMKRKSTS